MSFGLEGEKFGDIDTQFNMFVEHPQIASSTIMSGLFASCRDRRAQSMQSKKKETVYLARWWLELRKMTHRRDGARRLANDCDRQ